MKRFIIYISVTFLLIKSVLAVPNSFYCVQAEGVSQSFPMSTFRSIVLSKNNGKDYLTLNQDVNVFSTLNNVRDIKFSGQRVGLITIKVNNPEYGYATMICDKHGHYKIEAIAKENGTFKFWRSTMGDTIYSSTVTLSSPKSDVVYIAYFDIKHFKVKLQVNDTRFGSIAPTDTVLDVTYGEQVELYSLPKTDFEFIYWNVNFIDYSKEIQFFDSKLVIDAYSNMEILATFHAKVKVLYYTVDYTGCEGSEYTLKESEKVVVLEKDMKPIVDSVLVQDSIDNDIYHLHITTYNLHVYEEPNFISFDLQPLVVEYKPIDFDDVNREISEDLDAAHALNPYLDKFVEGFWSVNFGDGLFKYNGESVPKVDSVVIKYSYVTSCKYLVESDIKTVKCKIQDASNTEKCRDRSSISRYDWLIMIDTKELISEGYTFLKDTVSAWNMVTWYRTMSIDDNEEDDIEVGKGYYYTKDSGLMGSGTYYALITVPDSLTNVGCRGVMRTEYHSFYETSSLRTSLAPSIVSPSEEIQIYNLPSDDDMYINIYDANGVMCYSATTNYRNSISFIAQSKPGFYLVVVSGKKGYSTLKYLVR